MKKRSFLSAHSILLLISVFVAGLTYLIPSGKFDQLSFDQEDKVFQIVSSEMTYNLPATQSTLDSLKIPIQLEKFESGAISKPVGVPGSYKEIESNPQGLWALAQAPIKGIIEAADIIFLVLIIGGLIGIMNEIKVFDSGIASLSKGLKGKEFLLIIVTTVLIALGGTTFGLAEETMAFIPILVPVFIAARYDALTAVASIFLGSSIGTMCSTVNPFSTIIASDAAGITWTEGLDGRLFMLLICLTITIAYLMWYGKRVQNNPTKSLLYENWENPLKKQDPNDEVVPLNAKSRMILVVFALSFVVMVMGVSKYDWRYVEMTTTFLVASVLIALLAKMKEGQFIKAFMSGASDLLSVAFIIGIARGVSILMNDGNISDSVLYYASTATEGMSKGLFVNALFFVYNGLSFLIPSSSGMAVLTMPIMSPLGTSVGVPAEVIVNAYQFGQGIFAIINPTSLILMSLGVVSIGYNVWLKFIWPLLAVLTLVAMIFLTISVV